MTQTIEDQFQQAKALEASGAYVEAARLFAALKSVPEQEVRARRRLTECLMFLHRWSEAATEVAAIFALAPATPHDLKRWQTVRAQTSHALTPQDPVTSYVQAERAAGAYSEGYIVFTAAAPKTGSTSLSAGLAAALGGRRVTYLDLPPTATEWSTPWWPAVDALEGCALVNHCHLSPAPHVLAEIEKRPWVRVAVHLRNPFEAMESLIDMLTRHRFPNLLSGAPHLALAPDQELRDWLIEHHVHRLAKWMADWVALLDAGHPSLIGPTTMEMMRNQGQDGLARHLAHQLDGVTVRTCDTVPQRTGKRLEGAAKIRLTPAERAQVRKAMPAPLMARFGWA